jgi:hypothetical protein
MTFADEPWPFTLSLLPVYAERCDWLVAQFRDWAFALSSTYFFYDYKDEVDEATLKTFKDGVAAFGEKAPTYHIRFYADGPKIVWDLHSLMLTIQTLFGFALTDESRPLRMCKHCTNSFIAERANAVFCSQQCKNQYNVYKSRKKKQDID